MTKVSIILVHFGKKKILTDCINSIRSSKPRVSYEIVVVDNNAENRGYSKGNNLGVARASGEYVLILNPDTLVEKGAIDKLVQFIESNKKTGIVAPTLYDPEGQVYPLQGTRELTPWRGIFALSFINKLFPDNPVSRDYWMESSDKEKPREVFVVPGTAFLIGKDLFKKAGGFDENFFLYFEEFDLARRVKKLGYKIYVLSDAKVTHFWAAATPKSSKIKKIFAESRFYYFKKNFGVLPAIAVEAFARMSKEFFIFLLIFALGAFLRFYRLLPNIMFNGEMGTDYMNILGMLNGTHSWLIGPRTSHEWFFIPPISYWIYTGLLLLSKFDPVIINIFWAGVGALAVPVCYFYLKKLFDTKIALISAFLVAVSPAWLDITRAARYNAPVSILFFPYLYYLYKSIKGSGKSLFILGLILGFSMSFFPSPLLLIPVVIVSFIFYGIKPKLKYVLYSILGFLIPNITFIIYEFSDRFAITLNLISWIPYRILGFFGLYPKNTASPTVINDNFTSVYQFFSETFAGSSGIVSLVIFILLIIGFIYLAVRLFKNRKRETAFWLVLINLVVGYIGLFIHGNPPSHYYMVIYPAPIILASYLIVKSIKKSTPQILLVLILGSASIFYLIQSKWFYSEKVQNSYQVLPPPYSLQLAADNAILKDAAGKEFTIHRIGTFDDFENDFANNYIYILTIRGAKVKSDAQLSYTIVEGADVGTPPVGRPIWFEGGLEIWKSLP